MTITIEREQPKPQPEPPITKVVLELTAEEWHDLRHVIATYTATPFGDTTMGDAKYLASQKVGLTPQDNYTYNVYGLTSRILCA